VARYESRLMAFCRHLLGSREDAEDVLQEVRVPYKGAGKKAQVAFQYLNPAVAGEQHAVPRAQPQHPASSTNFIVKTSNLVSDVAHPQLGSQRPGSHLATTTQALASRRPTLAS